MGQVLTSDWNQTMIETVSRGRTQTPPLPHHPNTLRCNHHVGGGKKEQDHSSHSSAHNHYIYPPRHPTIEVEKKNLDIPIIFLCPHHLHHPHHAHHHHHHHGQDTLFLIILTILNNLAIFFLILLTIPTIKVEEEEMDIPSFSSSQSLSSSSSSAWWRRRTWTGHCRIFLRFWSPSPGRKTLVSLKIEKITIKSL